MEESGAIRRRFWKSEHDIFLSQSGEDDIFLSHSGDEKVFVEQLDRDLRRVNQRPFFDCLRKKFDPAILQAFEQCRVGVVVVSEGYLTSKKPMLELSKFVKCGVPLFPLFLKLSPSDLEDNKVVSKWKLWWRHLVQKGDVGEEVVELWSKAVKELRSSNGLDFGKFAKSEYNYRCAVVEEICKRWPPILDGIQENNRLREVMYASMFREAKVGGQDWRVEKYLGIYGRGGLGKTTLCKSMCSYFLGEFEFGGRVLHLELPREEANKGNGGKERLDRLKQVLHQLASFEKSVLNTISTEEQGWACLKHRLRDMLPVFLAIDNVGDFAASREEAQRYLKVGLPSGSKVLLTSRNWEIPIALLRDVECCKPIPRLQWVEAATLLLSCAAPNISSVSCLKAEERGILEKCLNQCQFIDSGYRYEGRQHHPLVLKALGTYFHDVCPDDVMSWGGVLEKEMRGCGEGASVNEILGLSYRSLSDEVKLVFLDSALCYRLFTKDNWRGWWFEEDQNDFQKWVSWISEVHRVSPFEAKRMVKQLQRLSLVEYSDSKVWIHDLYKEFAKAMVEKDGSKEWQWWMSRSSDQTQRLRLVLKGDRSIIGVPPGRYLELGSVVVLDLSECDDIGPDLELGSFHSVRTMSLVSCRNVRRILCSCNKGYDDKVCCYKRNPGRGCMSELLTVRLSRLESLEGIAFLRHCWNLEHFDMCCGSKPMRFADSECDEPIGFRYLQALESFSFYGSYFVGWDSDSLMTSLLCVLQLRNLVAFAFVYPGVMKHGNRYALDLNEGVRCVVSETVKDYNEFGLSPRLSFLHLSLPRQIEEVVGLRLLSELTLLNLSGSKGLLHLPDLRRMPKLKWLCVHGCRFLEGVPSVEPEVQGICESRGYEFLHQSHRHECLNPYSKEDSDEDPKLDPEDDLEDDSDDDPEDDPEDDAEYYSEVYSAL